MTPQACSRAMRAGSLSQAAMATPIESSTRRFTSCTTAAGSASYESSPIHFTICDVKGSIFNFILCLGRFFLVVSC